MIYTTDVMKSDKLEKAAFRQLVWVQYWLVVIRFYAHLDIQSGIHLYWPDESFQVGLGQPRFPWPFWIPVFSNNGRWANSSSWTCDQSESRPVGNPSCRWNIYPTRKLEIKGSYWSITWTNHNSYYFRDRIFPKFLLSMTKNQIHLSLNRYKILKTF